MEHKRLEVAQNITLSNEENVTANKTTPEIINDIFGYSGSSGDLGVNWSINRSGREMT